MQTVVGLGHLALIVGLVGLVGCTAPMRPSFRIEAGSGSNPAAVAEAASEWTEAIPALSFSDDAAAVIRIVEGDPGVGFAAMTTIEGVNATIIVRPEYVGDVSVLAHEIGHALGLDHAPEGLMKSAYPKDGRVTCIEVAAFCEIWSEGCPCTL